jgi:glc operon protein GlcG
MATRRPLQLTHGAALSLVAACYKFVEANKLTPVHIVVASRNGQILCSLAMDEAYFLSAETARNKALTAASHRIDTTRLPQTIARELAVASGGKITPMAGGMPIWYQGECVGGVGIGGASDDEDIAIALFGIEAVGGRATQTESLAVKPVD